jgi:hypothetical protein
MAMLSTKLFPIYTLISTSVIFVCFYFYGKFHFYRDPGSIFFDPNRALERHYSLEREQEALAFRNAAFYATKNYNATALEPAWKAGQDPTICGIFITVKRDTGKSSNPLEVSGPTPG